MRRATLVRQSIAPREPQTRVLSVSRNMPPGLREKQENLASRENDGEVHSVWRSGHTSSCATRAMWGLPLQLLSMAPLRGSWWALIPAAATVVVNASACPFVHSLPHSWMASIARNVLRLDLSQAGRHQNACPCPAGCAPRSSPRVALRCHRSPTVPAPCPCLPLW